MKTIDEVITANECCDHGEPDSRCEDCPYNGIGACCAERESDALQWLKGYKAHIELDKLRDKCETENDPLSWDELYSRNGMPVWIEDSFDNGEWYIIECFTASNRFVAHDRWGDTTLFNKKEMDDVWKAYRKERG